jgi:5-carboxymethyl-2-hydroxymuconate isomerase
VMAYPAPHYAVADGKADYAFVYLNLRMGKGRSEATKKRAGDALLMATKTHFQPVFMQRHIGITLQIDEGQEVFDGKHSNLHPLFNNTNKA